MEDNIVGAPIHLIHWGNSHREENEIDVIKIMLQESKNPGRIKAYKIEEENKLALKSTIEDAMLDPLLQILFISSHGSVDRLTYSSIKDSTFVSKNELAKWLNNLKPVEYQINPCRNIILFFGSCHGLEYDSDISEFMPEWVFDVYGFSGSPTYVEVVKYISGLCDDIYESGFRISENISASIKNTEGLSINEVFELMKQARDRTVINKIPARKLMNNKFLKDTEWNAIHFFRDEQSKWHKEILV